MYHIFGDTMNEKYRAVNIITDIYLILIFSVFPLFFTNQYANIRHDKYYFFLICSGLYILSCLTVLFLFGGFRQLRGFNITDAAFLSLIIVFSISTLLSDSPYESFFGTLGRNNGLLLYLVLFAVYLAVSRLYRRVEYVFIAFAVACAIVFMLCILNRFGIDPLKMYEGYTDYVRNDFTSTIGNKNIMSCYCCLTAPTFFALFINRKNTVRYLYLFISIIGIIAFLCSDSSGGYLGIVPVFAGITLYLLRKKGFKKLFWIFLGIIALAVLVSAVLLIYYTFFDTRTQLNGFSKFFRFNEKWGTHRGYMWIKSAEIFAGFDIKSILFGCGPDRFYAAFAPFFEELSSRYGDITTNCAHNEFLNYLITTGILGLASYLFLFGSAVARALKNAVKAPEALVFIVPIISYLLQSVVNIATPITTPLLFIFLALSESQTVGVGYSKKDMLL